MLPRSVSIACTRSRDCGRGAWPEAAATGSTFGERRDHQRLAFLGRDDLADIAAHQAVHPGHRAHHHEFFPHLLEDVRVGRGADRGAGEFPLDRVRPLADPAAALAEGDAGQAIDVADAAVRQQHRADIGDAAEHPARAEGAVEPVQMDEAVEQRQHRGLRPDAGADRLDRGVEIVMLCGQQHDVVGAADPVGGRDLDRHREIAERAFDLEPVFGERGGARRRAPET